MYNVMVVEDQAMPRQLFEAFIAMNEKYRLVHSIKNADMADIYCDQSQIDLILMDVCTELNSNGLDAAERIKQKHPEIKIRRSARSQSLSLWTELWQVKAFIRTRRPLSASAI